MAHVHHSVLTCLVCCFCLPVWCSEDVDYTAFGRDLQSFFAELESLNSSLVVTADSTVGKYRLMGLWVNWVI
jgi:hypothetical protein